MNGIMPFVIIEGIDAITVSGSGKNSLSKMNSTENSNAAIAAFLPEVFALSDENQIPPLGSLPLINGSQIAEPKINRGKTITAKNG
jgi:hypothetical protein